MPDNNTIRSGDGNEVGNKDGNADEIKSRDRDIDGYGYEYRNGNGNIDRDGNDAGNENKNEIGNKTVKKDKNHSGNKMEKAFENGKALIGFLTAGDPSLEKTKEYILTMADAGADLIEIGIPFSDPIAEGEVIQRANTRALQAGTTTDRLFDMVASVREKIDIPLVLLTYMNPVFVYGIGRFFDQCKKTGINGIIIPDLPYEEKEEVRGIAGKARVELITMIAPTSEDRIGMLASDASGFVYVVSSMGVTGVRSDIHTDLKSIIGEIRKFTNTKIAVGFGISTADQVREIAGLADGVIIGSAIVRIIEEFGENADGRLAEYVRELKRAM